MSMSKKDFIELADQIKEHNRLSERNPETYAKFTSEQLKTIGAACYRSNTAFKRDRWLSYIKGECGPSGGEVKVKKVEYQPKTGIKCSCKPGIQRDNCSNCEATGWIIDFAAIRQRA